MSNHPRTSSRKRKEVPPRGTEPSTRPVRAVKRAASRSPVADRPRHRHVQPDARRFAAAVKTITRNCGSAAKHLLLSCHPRLPGPVVFKIARTHPDRQRFALAQARAGRDPFGSLPPGIDPPFDTRGPGEVLNRLGRNIGALDKVADGLRDLPRCHWPKVEDIAAMLTAAEAIARQARQMKRIVKDSRARTPGGKARQTGGGRNGRARKPFDPRFAHRDVAAVAGVTAKNFRDLPRTLSETPPTEVQREALLTRLGALEAAALRLSAVINWRGHDNSTGPSGVPGTYVVFFRLAQPMEGLTIGALGTFDFPAGVYAYLGSAFGAGGVRKRTGRHLTSVSKKKKWNIDWLKPHCVPVAVWWTHDRRKVEFAWADVLAALPGASFPAMRFGAADNNGAQAHLVRFDQVPQIAEFRRLVAESVTEHATAFVNVIQNPTGSGWPECPKASDENTDTGDTQMSDDEVTQAGTGDGRWWAEHKATEEELERLSNWMAQMEFDGVDPLETGESASSPYTPAERVYFVLAPEDDGDRTAAKWFWEPLFDWEKFGKHDRSGRYVRGFLHGAIGCESG